MEDMDMLFQVAIQTNFQGRRAARLQVDLVITTKNKRNPPKGWKLQVMSLTLKINWWIKHCALIYQSAESSFRISIKREVFSKAQISDRLLSWRKTC